MKRVEAQRIMVSIIGVLTLAGSGCGFFGGDDERLDDGSASATVSTQDDSDTSPDDGPSNPPPSEGFAVFPKYMLIDVSAVVTVDDGQTPQPCPVDPTAGGYLCDTSGVSGPTVTIRVERDGFDPAIREPTKSLNQIETLDVHLSVEGGPTGMWSSCTVPGEFETCEQVCDAEGLGCSAVNCATEDSAWPVATQQLFAVVDCLESPMENLAIGCDTALPIAGEAVASLRCCCGS